MLLRSCCKRARCDASVAAPPRMALSPQDFVDEWGLNDTTSFEGAVLADIWLLLHTDTVPEWDNAVSRVHWSEVTLDKRVPLERVREVIARRLRVSDVEVQINLDNHELDGQSSGQGRPLGVHA